MNYTDEIPETQLPLFSKRQKVTKQNELKIESEILFKYKSKDWDYEEEFRYISINVDKEDWHYCKQGSNSIPKDKIKKIILGPFMGDNEKKYIINIIKENLPGVDCYESRISSDQYAVIEDNKILG